MSKTLVHRMCDAVRKGEKMSLEDLSKFIEGVARHSISVTLIEEWLKSIHSHGISVEETTALTAGMMNSGAVLSWKGDANVCDKHSTGGVGDKMSLILAPALSACGVRIPMLAGRGLGHTGGTIDKLESIPGFNCNLSPDAMSVAVEEVGCCIAAQNDSIAPADGLLYAIRDVTDTVDSIPLITASIVSKKAAEGLNALVLDVKCGQAAFMKTEQDAVQLAESMVRTANGLGIRTIAQITDMNEPIGTHIGNALEVTGSILVLQGRGSKDTRELVMLQGGQLLNLIGKAATLEDGMQMIGRVLDGGQALNAFVAMCIQQGTSSTVAQQLAADPQSVLPQSSLRTELTSSQSGYVDSIDAMALAEVARELGAGRFTMDDEIAHTVGFVLHSAKNAVISAGETWMVVHHEEPLSSEHRTKLIKALRISNQRGEPFTRLIRTVDESEQ